MQTTDQEQKAALGDDLDFVAMFLEALPSDLPGAVEKYGAETVSWALPPTVPGGGRPWVGKQAVIKFLTIMQAGFEPGSMRIAVHELLGGHGRFAARLTITARTVTGRDYANDYAFFISAEGGQITDVLEFVDTAKVLSVFE